MREFDVRTPEHRHAGRRALGRQPAEGDRRPRARRARSQLLIASQPTRGLDVGSIEFIHRRIVAARDRGAAVLLVSAELDEILALSDRIAVMYQGRIVADARRRRGHARAAGAADGGGGERLPRV